MWTRRSPAPAKTIAEALKESERCALHLEDTAGAGGTLGRSFEELAALIEQAGGGKRLGGRLTPATCSPPATTSARRTGCRGPRRVRLRRRPRRLASLHFNDSATPLGSNVDRHAPPAEGHIGREGCAAFLSEPRFDGMPLILEGPGQAGKGIVEEDIGFSRELREEGLKARKR